MDWSRSPGSQAASMLAFLFQFVIVPLLASLLVCLWFISLSLSISGWKDAPGETFY